jgi:hypothetical protein
VIGFAEPRLDAHSRQDWAPVGKMGRNQRATVVQLHLIGSRLLAGHRRGIATWPSIWNSSADGLGGTVRANGWGQRQSVAGQVAWTRAATG